MQDQLGTRILWGNARPFNRAAAAAVAEKQTQEALIIQQRSLSFSGCFRQKSSRKKARLLNASSSLKFSSHI
jgi:hypothetical protein